MGTAFYAVCDKVIFFLLFLSVLKDGGMHARIVLVLFLCEGIYFFPTLCSVHYLV